MLAGGPPDPGAAQGQTVLLCLGHLETPGGQILLHVAVGGLLRHGTDGAGPEDVALPEELKGVLVGVGLVLPGEVQVDVGDLLAPVAQEGLKGDVEPILHVLCAADGAHGVGHVRPAAVGLPGGEVRVLALGAAVMGGQGVDLRDPRQEGHDGGAHRPPGAHQVAVLQGVLHQFLGGHVDDVVFPLNDARQFQFDSVLDDLRRILPVEFMCLAPHQVVQLLGGVFQLGGKQAIGQGLDLVAPGGHQLGVGDHHLVGLLLPQVGKLLQHLLGGAEVEGVGGIGIVKALGVQQDVAVGLVLRV